MRCQSRSNERHPTGGAVGRTAVDVMNVAGINVLAFRRPGRSVAPGQRCRWRWQRALSLWSGWKAVK